MQVEEDLDDRDAETRVAAVRALAAVAQKLFAAKAHQAQEVKSDENRTQAAAVRDHVIKPLLAAMEDYSTDNRSVTHHSRQQAKTAMKLFSGFRAYC